MDSYSGTSEGTTSRTWSVKVIHQMTGIGYPKFSQIFIPFGSFATSFTLGIDSHGETYQQSVQSYYKLLQGRPITPEID